MILRKRTKRSLTKQILKNKIKNPKPKKCKKKQQNKTKLEEKVISTNDSILSLQQQMEIKDACMKVNESKCQELYNEFIATTTHIYGNNILDLNITSLLNKHAIESYELFYSIYKTSCPHGMGFLQSSEEIEADFTKEKAKKILEYDNYVDYWDGKAIKTKFRTNMWDTQIVDLRRIDNRSFDGCTYLSVLTLLNEKMF